ncbi:hypothetical protein KFL_007490080 [Klebsormidium nitens]|uniref:Uncharacterized protein n=1 Tax=Klebsormidium nitens TaxID=105231 RepID=A0A1Y1IP26_KLENI|nr:hypothetical protein KFL_007490080 [Klebsormidium nitens]|eukprot:GAQ91239.1 hypothetical protein KFL_007490080 [Klebsormidium nitens]
MQNRTPSICRRCVNQRLVAMGGVSEYQQEAEKETCRKEEQAEVRQRAANIAYSGVGQRQSSQWAPQLAAVASARDRAEQLASFLRHGARPTCIVDFITALELFDLICDIGEGDPVLEFAVGLGLRQVFVVRDLLN